MKKYICNYCLDYFSSESELENHKNLIHEVIYVPFSKEELGHLLQFIYTGQTSLLSKGLVHTLQKYNRAAVKKEMHKKPEKS